jgi:hypothetical protein
MPRQPSKPRQPRQSHKQETGLCGLYLTWLPWLVGFDSPALAERSLFHRFSPPSYSTVDGFETSSSHQQDAPVEQEEGRSWVESCQPQKPRKPGKHEIDFVTVVAAVAYVS